MKFLARARAHATPKVAVYENDVRRAVSCNLALAIEAPLPLFQ